MADWHGPAMIAALAALLIGIAYFLPANTLTGNVVINEPCGPPGCVELCDYDAQDACTTRDTVCCFTHWESGVCDYSFNCERIREYSLYSSLDTYRESRLEQPSPINPTWRRFFFPILATLAIIGYFVWKRDEP